MRLAPLALLCLLAACDQARPAADADADAEPAMSVAPATAVEPLRLPVLVAQGLPAAEAARAVLDVHCGGCHRSDLETARPGALAVYDLTQPWWQVTLTDPQLEDVQRRIDDLPEISAEEQQVIRAFVAAEQSRRRGGC